MNQTYFRGPFLYSKKRSFMTLDKLLAQSPVPVLITDENNTVLQVSHALLRLFSKEPHDLIGKVFKVPSKPQRVQLVDGTNNVHHIILNSQFFTENNQKRAAVWATYDEEAYIKNDLERELEKLQEQLSELSQSEQSLTQENHQLREQMQVILEQSKSAQDENAGADELTQELVTVQRIAYEDPITKLPNHNLISQYLASVLAEPEAGQSVTVVLIHLDQLTQMERILGTEKIQELLYQSGQRLRTFTDDGIWLGRYSKKEFLMVLAHEKSHHQPDHPFIQQLTENLHDYLSRSYRIEGGMFQLPYSLGLVTASPEILPEELIEQARQSAWTTRKKGKSSLFSHYSQNQKNLTRQKTLVGDVHKGIQNQEFYLVYQPVIQSLTGKTVGFETFLRWMHPIHGELSPNAFLHTVERHEVGLELYDWVTETICKTIQHYPQVFFSMNISIHQLTHADFIYQLIAILTKEQVPRSRFHLEISEAVLANLSLFEDTLSQLQEQQLAISIDDFGSGSISLKTLATYTPNIIKIKPQSFLQTQIDKVEQSIYYSSLKLAQSIGSESCTVGVESQEHMRYAIEQGSNLLQGYFFSPPVKENHLTGLLEKNWLEA